jgi:hypothetical protein
MVGVQQLLAAAEARGSLEKVKGSGSASASCGDSEAGGDTPLSSTHGGEDEAGDSADGDEDAAFLASDDTVALIRFWHRSVNQEHFNATLRGVLQHPLDVPLQLPLQAATTALILAAKVPQWWTQVSPTDIAVGDSIDFAPAQLHCGGIWLHSWRYEGPSWHFHASLPKWGQLADAVQAGAAQ